jgi:hypothetical protein
MDRIEVGGRDWLTVCQLDVVIPADVPRAMPRWRTQAIAAIAIVATLLDERIAQAELLEDLLILDQAGDEVIGVVDHVTRLRTFQSANRMLAAHQDALGALSTLDLGEERTPISASRWYLRGGQLGPTADAVVFFWIALEALSKPSFGAKLTKAEKVRTDARVPTHRSHAPGARVQEVGSPHTHRGSRSSLRIRELGGPSSKPRERAPCCCKRHLAKTGGGARLTFTTAVT